MSHVFFEPFVGKYYQTEGYAGKKLLILGESHYCDKKYAQTSECENENECLQLAECQKFTKDVAVRFLKYKQQKAPYESWMRTWTTFTNVFLGGQASTEIFGNV